jgi:uncharacterized coiled-coil protein SlyX
MNEIDYKNLLAIYQQKSSDLFTQTIALESRIITSNQIIESLSNKVNELTGEIEKLKSASAKTKKSAAEKSDSWEE